MNNIKQLILLLLVTPFIIHTKEQSWPSCWWSDFCAWSRGIKQDTPKFIDELFDPHGTIVIENMIGKVIVKGWTLPKITVEAIKEGTAENKERIRIDTNISEHKAFITTHQISPTPATVSYRVMVPTTATVHIKQQSGLIKTKQIKGAQKIVANKGPVTVIDAAQSLSISTNNTVYATFTCLPLNSTIEINCLTDCIVYLPSFTHATLSAQALRGYITSELFVTLKPLTVQLNAETWARMKREVYGTLGNGGASINLTSKQGSIKLFKY